MDKTEILKALIEEINKLEDENLNTIETVLREISPAVTPQEILLLSQTRNGIIETLELINKVIAGISRENMNTFQREARLQRYYKVRAVFTSALCTITQKISSHTLH